MDFWGDERGQPVQIGFILLFGILVLAFAGYQGYVVPNQNAEIEFNHFQSVEDQFTEFQSNLVNAVGSETKRATTFSLGVQYPSRLLALNPPPVNGQLRTTDPVNVSIVDVDNDQRVADVCGSTDATSRSLVYSSGYNEFDNAEATTYENGFVARTYREGIVFGDQRLVKEVGGGNDRIDLTLLNGSVSENGQGSYSLEVNATHRYSTTVTDPTITIPSQFDSDAWQNDILKDYSAGAADVGGDRVALEFTGDYKVSCAVAGLDGPPEFTPPTPTPDSPTTELLAAPTIMTADLTRYEELGTVDHIFGTNSVETVSQYDLTYEVEAIDGNLEKVALYLRNPDDEVVTATTQTVPSDSVDQYEGRWITPWFDDEELDGDEEDYSVGIEVFGKNSPSQSGYIEVGGELQSQVRFEVDITGTNSPVTAGSDLDVDVTVHNTGQDAGSQTIELLDFGGNVVDSQQVTLNGGESDDITLTWETDSGNVGTGDITVRSSDHTDTAGVEVEANGGGGGEQSSDQMELVEGSGTTFWENQGVQFQLENTGDEQIEITGIRFDSTSRSQVANVYESNGGAYSRGQHEVYIDGSGYGFLESGTPLQLGTMESMTDPAGLNGDSTATVYVYAFRNGGGNIVYMSGETADITFEFGDESSKTYTVNID